MHVRIGDDEATIEEPRGDDPYFDTEAIRDELRKETLRSGLRVAIGLCLPLGLFWSAIATPWFLAVYGVSAAAWLAVMIGTSRHLQPVLAGRLACSTLFGLCFASVYLLGGTNSAAGAQFLIVPAAGGYACGKRDAWGWVVISAVAMLAIDSGLLPDRPIGGTTPSTLIVIPCLVVLGMMSATWVAGDERLECRLERETRELAEIASARDLLLRIARITQVNKNFESAARQVTVLLETLPGIVAAGICDLTDFAETPRVIRPHDDDALEQHDTASRLMLQGPDVDYVEDLRGCATWIRSGDEIFGVLELVADPMSRRVRHLITQTTAHLASLAANAAIESALRRETLEDFVTGLQNRRAFEQQLEVAVRAANENGHRAALLFIDLDGFKRINDGLGHAAGDQVLRTIARRIQKSVRLTDSFIARAGGSDPVARLGGDEFTILLDEVAEARGVEVVAARVIEAIEKPIEIARQDLRVRTSIGIALYPDDADSAASLIRAADAAMYEAKRFERSTYRRTTGRSEIGDSLGLERELRDAIERNDLSFHLQPIFDAHEGTILGAEVLIRWHHPTQGWISPATFIPIAERHGFMREVGSFVFHAAYQWFESSFDILPSDFRLALNVSPRQIEDEGFVLDLTSRLAEGSIDVSRFELEITETALIGDTPELGAHLRALAGIGVSFSLDDFGTGYSSLTLIKSAPIKRLKIDRSFVNGLPDNPEDVAIVTGTLRMAQELGLFVVAEGIETEEQQEFLTERGCDELQGFLLARPMEPDALVEFIRTHARASKEPRD